MNHDGLPQKKQYLLILSICLMAFIFNADYLAVNLALKPIIEQFNSQLETVQWLLSGYMLAWSLLVIPSGKLLEVYSTRQVAIVGIILFMLGSILSGIAMNVFTIIAARVLQGAAGAIFLPASFAMVVNYFNEDKRGSVMGLVSLSVGIGLALGPIFGGALIAWLGWRSIFFVNIPIGFLVILIVMFVDKMPAKQPDSVQKMSKHSLLLLASGLTGLLFLLGQQSQWGNHPVIYSMFLAAVAVTLISFFRLQQRIKNPLIPFDLFRNDGFVGCCLGIFAIEYAFSTMVIIMGLYLQKDPAMSSFNSSLVFLSMTLIFGITAVFSGQWTDKRGIRLPVVFGLVVLMMTSMCFSLFTAHGSLGLTCIVFMTMGLGAGLAFAALNAGIVKTVSAEQIGIASSVFLMITLLGNAVGVAMSTSLYLVQGMSSAMLVNALLCLIASLFCYRTMDSKTRLLVS